MKSVILFLGSTVVGIALLFSYNSLSQKIPQTPHLFPSPTPLFSLDQAPKQTMPGKVTSMTGGIAWQSRSATQAAILTHLTNLQQGEEITTQKNGFLTVTFTDLLTISAYPKTHLAFIQTLPTSFVVSQDLGKVVYTNKSETPLAVRINSLIVKLDTGEMVIMVGENQTNITLREGTAIAAYNSSDKTTMTKEITKSQSVIYDEDSHELITQ